MSWDDSSIDINPWPVSELIARTACLGALGQRLALEINVSGAEDLFDLETDRFDLHAWARLELAHALSPTELAILNVPVRTLRPDQEDFCLRAMVGTSTLGWALNLGEIDRLPVGVDDTLEQDVLTWVPSPWDQVRHLSKRVRLRSIDTLAEQRERWELIFWRLSLDASDDDAPSALRDVIAEVTEVEILNVLDGDFATDDQQLFSELNQNEVHEFSELAAVRLQTLNWICGIGETWDTAPLLLDD